MKVLRVFRCDKDTDEVQVHSFTLSRIETLQCKYIPAPKPTENDEKVDKTNESNLNISMTVAMKSGNRFYIKFDGPATFTIIEEGCTDPHLVVTALEELSLEYFKYLTAIEEQLGRKA